MNVIPNTVVDAFARGEILQVLLFSMLFGLALLRAGERVKPLVALISQLSQALFGVIEMLMRLAPIGAFGAMAFTVGRYGIGTLISLGQLMAGVYLTCALFVVVVLGLITRGRPQPVEAPALHQRRDSDRRSAPPRRNRRCRASSRSWRTWLREVGRRPRDSDRLLVQSRWHRHLHDDGDDVRGAGQRRAPSVGDTLSMLAC